MGRFAFLFPGQGAQYPGMGKDFHDQFSVARQTFEEADDLLKYKLSTLIFEGPAPELTLTKNSQVAIFVTSIALLRTVQSLFPHLVPSACAGLSLGEYTALTAAEKLSFAECLSLVSRRALYMHEACEKEKGKMAVVIGQEPSFVEEGLRGLTGVWIANLNCPGQVVIAGTEFGLKAAEESLKAKGVKRVLPLEVSGAFHTQLMASAKERLSPHIDAAHFKESSTAIVMNVPGDYVTDPMQMRSFLKEQVTSPVYWEKGIRAMMAVSYDTFLEIGPGTTLAGMNKRIGVEQPTRSIQKTTDLEGLDALT